MKWVNNTLTDMQLIIGEKVSYKLSLYFCRPDVSLIRFSICFLFVNIFRFLLIAHTEIVTFSSSETYAILKSFHCLRMVWSLHSLFIVTLKSPWSVDSWSDGSITCLFH